MPTLQELREKRAVIWSQMTEIMDRTAGVPEGEDAAAYDRAETDMDALETKIMRGEKFAKTEKAFDQIDRAGVVPGQRDGKGESDAAYSRAFLEFMKSANGVSDLEPEDRKALQAGYRTDSQFRNAAGVGTGVAGGYMVPPAFRQMMVEAMLAYGPMLRLAETFETDSGVNIPWATNDDTANEGAILGENTQVTEQDVTLGAASLDAYMYSSKLVRASFQLLQDRPDFDRWLARKLAERLARIYNRHATTGTGTAQPDGIVTSATVGTTGSGSFASTGGVPTYDNIVDLVESVDDAYLSSINARFMMHQVVRKGVRKIKDTAGRPLWEPSIQVGTPDSLLGYPLEINNHMATLAQNSKSLLFGDIREAYVIRTVRQNELIRFNERYADFLQIGFLTFGRMDGTMQNAAAVRVYQATPTA